MKTDKSEFFHRLVLLLLVTALSVMGFMQMFEKSCRTYSIALWHLFSYCRRALLGAVGCAAYG